MNSVVSLRTFANASNVPIVVFVDPQQEHVGALRLPETSGNAHALHHCRKGFAGESSLISTPIDAFQRNQKVTCLCDASVPAGEFHRAASETFATDAWITSPTLPHKLGIRKNAGG